MTGDDVADGQALIDELCWRFGQGTNNAEGQPTDPFAGERNDSDDADTPSHAEVGNALRDNVSYDGDDPAEWDIPEDESTEYHAVLRARERSDELLNTANWELIGYAAALGKRDGLSKENVLRDLQNHPTPQYGYDDDRARKEVRGVWRKMDNGNYHPPSVKRLKSRGILPESYVSLDELHTDDTLSGKQKWEAWSKAREAGKVGEDSIVPDAALEYLARKEGWYDFSALPDSVDELPAKVANKALYWVNTEWWDPNGEKDTDATKRRYKSRDPESVWTWEDVRYIYEDSNKRGRLAAETLLRDRYHFISVPVWDDSLHVYDPDTGTYSTMLGDVRGEIHEGLDDHWGTRELNEITARLEQQNVVQPDELNGRQFDDPHICVENGVLNLFTRDLKPHDPDYYYTKRVPVTYDENAETEPYEWFLDSVADREADAKAMVEMVGHALTPDAHERRWKNFMILYGSTDNGKTVFYDSVRALLNGPDATEENVMGVKLEKISGNRFSKDAMHGTMANIAGEVDGKKIRKTAGIKDITGGELMEIEPKGGKSFADTMNTTLMFAANDPPIIGERDKEAIATRIVPIELPYRFVDEPAEPHHKKKIEEGELADRLRKPEALSGLLNLALDGIQRLRENNGDVSLPETRMERLKRYEGNADPMKEFSEKCLTDHPDDHIVKADAVTIFKEFARQNDYELGSSVKTTLFDVLEYTDSHPRPPYYEGTSLPLRDWRDRKKVIDRVTLTETGLEYAESAGLIETTGGSESDSQQAITDCGTGLHQTPIQATVAEKIDPPEWLEGKGHLVDGDGGIMPYVVEGTDVFSDVEESETVELRNVKIKERDGVLTAVLSGITDVSDATASDTPEASDTGQSQLTATADGGDEITTPTGRVKQYLRIDCEKGDVVTVAGVAGSLDGLSPDDAEYALDKIREEDSLLRGVHNGWKVLQ